MRKIVRNQEGFTLIEIIAVLILLGILAAVAVPKYMDLTETARTKAAMGQISEVKGRLNSSLARYMLDNSGKKPATATALISYANSVTTDACPTSLTLEGDFKFYCSDSGNNATLITVTYVQTSDLDVNATSTYDFD